MPTSLPGVTIDDHRTCNYCLAFDERYQRVPQKTMEESMADFSRLMDRYRGKGDYDALVPVSGGKDSMYVLYAARRLFNLNVLAYNFDNGFQSPAATLNIQRAVKKLGTDLIVYKPREDLLNQLYRTFLTQAGEFCSPCNMIIGAAAFRIARQNGIKIILLGGSAKRESGILGVSMSMHCDRYYYRHVVDGRLQWSDFKKYVVDSPWRKFFQRITGTGAVDIDALEYFHPGGDQMRAILRHEIGWEKTSEELEHGDCFLNPLKDYIMNHRWGYSEVTQAYSALVRNGELTRERALEKAEKAERRTPPQILPAFLERIGMTKEEFDKAIKHHFTEFPNYLQSRMYRMGKQTMSIIRSMKP
jgi:hypothetical protein